jgi:hypothetical protein
MIHRHGKVMAILAIVCALTATATASNECREDASYLVPPSRLAAAPYNEWAHHHWVWLSAGEANQTSMLGIIADHRSSL